MGNRRLRRLLLRLIVFDQQSPFKNTLVMLLIIAAHAD